MQTRKKHHAIAQLLFTRVHIHARTHKSMHAHTYACKNVQTSTQLHTLLIHARSRTQRMSNDNSVYVCVRRTPRWHQLSTLYPRNAKEERTPRKRRGKERGMSRQGEWNTADTKWHFLPKPLRVKGWWLFPGSSICRAIYMLLRRLMFFYFFLKFVSSFYFFLIFFLRNVTCLLVIVTWFFINKLNDLHCRIFFNVIFSLIVVS